MTDTVIAEDGLPAEVVGRWADDKHAHLAAYVRLSAGARAKMDRPAFIDPFCACGLANIAGTREFIDGSPVVAWKASSGRKPFDKVCVADIVSERREACVKRLQRLNAPVVGVPGDALSAVKAIVAQLPRAPLHLAFLDPHSLGDLSLDLIRELARFERIDILMHVSAMDMQRNLLSQFADDDKEAFDAFAPGWKSHVSTAGTQQLIRAALLEYWLGLVRGMGFKLRVKPQLIKAPHGQRLYWLVLASREELADKLWEAVVRATPAQKELKL